MPEEMRDKRRARREGQRRELKKGGRGFGPEQSERTKAREKQ